VTGAPPNVARDDAAMRRRLLLVRHAKSAWDDPSLDDHDRPLAPRGIEALPRLCDHLTRVGHRPELVLCSSSRRTRDTLDGIRAVLPEDARVEIDGELYLADADELLARLRGIDGDDGHQPVTCALLVGHNPGLQDLATLLGGTGDAGVRARVAAKLPTAAAVTLSFDAPWAELRPGAARMGELFTPRPPRP
jgi:phosphohistidine phosphatase